MLRQLQIQNYAIIENIDISFSPQLNIITGETGAGKSIVIGALSLILGERADTSILLKNDKKCMIEGRFAVADKKTVKDFLQQNDLDHEEELILRREINPGGKSRAFINDTPATLQQLKTLASLLVNLHQQFDTLELADSGFQLQVLDALAKNETKLNQYQKKFYQFIDTKKELEQLQLQKTNNNKELDYHQFLYEELSDAGLQENELENLDQELQLLCHAEAIKIALTKTNFELQENENPIVPLLKQLVNQLSVYRSYHPELPAVIDRLQSAQIELQDLAGEVESIGNSVVYDESRIEWINERLASGYKLLKKHDVKTTTELLQIQYSLEEKLQSVLNLDEAISALEKQVSIQQDELDKLADSLTETRKKQSEPFIKKVNHLLIQVGMPNARLKVQITETGFHLFGKDTIEFLFDANNTGRFEPIRKVASGGELSRLMLCIKSLVAASIDLPTMIFDEIDSGISGEAAKQVGIIMKDLAEQRQVIAITHQPQIAGKAHAHYFVFKEMKNNALFTSIRLLTEEERILTIAQMLSGEKPTAAALQNAREMVTSN